MLTSNDIKRIKEDPKVKRLNNLAKACANANSDDFKNLWYSKLMKLGKEYNMTDYVTRKLLH